MPWPGLQEREEQTLKRMRREKGRQGGREENKVNNMTTGYSRMHRSEILEVEETEKPCSSKTCFCCAVLSNLMETT